MNATVTDPQQTASGWPTPPRAGKRAGFVALVLVLATTAGAGSYLAARSGGEDLDAARAAGKRDGAREAKAREGRRGYEEGFSKGRRSSYERTYRDAYIRAYEREFEKAGVAAPGRVPVP